MVKKDNLTDIIILMYILFFILIGLFLQTPAELLLGLKNIVISTGILITDYTVISGVGPTLVNGGLVGLIGFILIKKNDVPMVGASIAAIFTMIGFAFFGKNIVNILPIILGVYFYSRYMKKEFRAYIYPALYGTALAPLVSEVAIHTPLGILGGLAVGIIAGMIVPPLATHLLSGHEGHNLYNIGFTAGFTGLLLTNILRGFSYEPQAVSLWGTEHHAELRILMLVLTISLIIVGFFVNGRSFKGYKDLLNESGVLISDFVNSAGLGNTLMNMGIVGLIGMFYIEIVNGDYNGATLGGLLTMIGFASFGKQPKNIFPVMLGVYLATIFSPFPANAPGALLAALFVTTIAPLAGNYGFLIGVLAGFVHLSVVHFTGILHGGLNLYNNGFTGGLVATAFVGIINGYKDRE